MGSISGRSFCKAGLAFAVLSCLVPFHNISAIGAPQGAQAPNPAPPAGRAGAPAGSGGGGGGGIGNMGRSLPLTDFDDHAGFTQIFDGKTLNGWDGDPSVWRVEDGAIVAESTAEKPSGNTFLNWRGGEPANFELKFEAKWEGTGNGGIQIRSRNVPYPPARGGGAQSAQTPAATAAAMFHANREKWNMGGPQLNIQVTDAGSNYEMFGRGWIAGMGNVVHLQEGKPPMLVGTIRTVDELMKIFKPSDWNQYHIVASGNTLAYIVNGQLFSLTIDDDYTKRSLKGLIGIEIESRGVSKASTRNIWIKNLPPGN